MWPLARVRFFADLELRAHDVQLSCGAWPLICFMNLPLCPVANMGVGGLWLWLIAFRPFVSLWALGL